MEVSTAAVFCASICCPFKFCFSASGIKEASEQEPYAIFAGAMVGRSDKGLLITTGTFTPDAKREATRDGAPAIDLIDGDQLCDLLKQLKLGVQIEMVEKPVIQPTWFDNI